MTPEQQQARVEQAVTTEIMQPQPGRKQFSDLSQEDLGRACAVSLWDSKTRKWWHYVRDVDQDPGGPFDTMEQCFLDCIAKELQEGEE